MTTSHASAGAGACNQHFLSTCCVSDCRHALERRGWTWSLFPSSFGLVGEKGVKEGSTPIMKELWKVLTVMTETKGCGDRDCEGWKE